jgi:hypothetical protein
MTIVKLTVKPAFTDENKTTIRLVYRKEAYQIVRRETKQCYGHFEINGKKSKYTEWKTVIKTSEIEELFALIKNETVPIIPEYLDGLDGADYELELFISGHALKYSWWSVPPESYKSLGEFSDRLISLSDADVAAD